MYPLASKYCNNCGFHTVHFVICIDLVSRKVVVMNCAVCKTEVESTWVGFIDYAKNCGICGTYWLPNDKEHLEYDEVCQHYFCRQNAHCQQQHSDCNTKKSRLVHADPSTLEVKVNHNDFFDRSVPAKKYGTFRLNQKDGPA